MRKFNFSLGKKILGITLASICIYSSSVLAAEPEEGVQILKYDRPANVSLLPDNFRTAQSDFKKIKEGKKYPSREGLNDLKLSGSSSFAKNEFKEMIKYLPKKDVVILDLRNESHGYINDNAVSWYSRYKTFNKGKNAQEVDEREHKLLENVLNNNNIDIATLAKDKSISTLTNEKVESVMTEKEFVESQGFKYYRIPVMDYTAPTVENVEQFLSFYKSLPKNTWIHAHCEQGIGRTTIFLSMIDMINNADKLSYDEIMTREVLLGGEDVRKSASNAKDAYKKVNYVKRADFTKHFYDYVKANPDLKMSWGTWLESQGYNN